MTDYKNTPEESGNYRQGRDGRRWTGIFILIIGVALLLKSSNLFIPHWVFSWQMFLIGLGLFIGIRHNFRDFTWAILILIGGFFLITDIFPEFDFIPRWPVILIIIGLFFILRPGRGRRITNWGNVSSSPSDSASIDDTNYSNEDYVEGTSIFGGTKKNVLSKNFKGADLVNIFGGSELDLMQADFAGTAIIELTTVFGGTKLLVPSNWNVRSEAVTIFGGMDDKRKMPVIQERVEKTLLIRGTIIFGGIEIKSY